MKRFLGVGRASQFMNQLKPGEVCEEEGKNVFAIDESDFCQSCDGCGCRFCNFTGDESERLKCRRKK
jgi:hypothetical protein